MKARSNIPVVVTLLAIGLANAAAVWIGLSLIAKSIERQQFYLSSSPTRNEVVTLPDNKFAVIQGYTISVYQVDTNGKITRLSDVNTLRHNLTPERRYD